MQIKMPSIFAVMLACLCLQSGCSTLSEAFKSKKDSGFSAMPGESTLGLAKDSKSSSKQAAAKPISDAEYNAQLLQGKNFERVKKWEEARGAYELLIAARPDRYEAFHRLAVVADRQQRYTEAEALYSQAIRLSPGNPELFNDLGYSFLLQNEFAKAEVAILKAVAIAPSTERYRNNLGLAYGFQGRYEEAMEQFRKAGSEADACCNMAFVLSQQGRVELAEQYLRNAISRDPQHKAARKALESLYATPETTDDALLAQGVQRWESYEEYGSSEESATDVESSVVQTSHATPSTAARVASFGRPTAQSQLRSARSAWSAGIQEQIRE
ncbi:hypothetical protein JCM17478_02850 [Thermopirellula anaerolimosa]